MTATAPYGRLEYVNRLGHDLAEYWQTQPFMTIPITPQHHALITDYTNATLFNDTALTIARHFQQAHSLAGIPAEWTAAWRKTAVRDTLHQMIRHQILVPTDAENTQAEMATSLSAWLHVTDRCNLRCAYCYLPHKKEDLSWENDLSASFADLQLKRLKFQIIEGMQAAFAKIRANMPAHSLLASLVDRANLAIPHQRTCRVGHSDLVFNQHGQVSQCQMHQGQPVADVHAEDPLALVRQDQVDIQNLPVQEKEGCRDCQWRSWCTVGCPLATFRATGRYDVQSPNCNIYKALYAKAVRLEGLCLLKAELSLETAVPFNRQKNEASSDCAC